MDLDAVLDAIARAFDDASTAIELEQATSGLDARDELALHAVIHAGLSAAGFGVYPEQRFPSARDEPRRSRGARCDVVVTPPGRVLEGYDASLPLFGARPLARLEDAAWIEVKVVAQHKPLGPNYGYTQALLAPVWKDVEKLARDPQIVHAAVLLVLFTASEAIAEHDVGVWAARASMGGLRVGPRSVRNVAIGDRIGNRVCTLALFPIERPS